MPPSLVFLLCLSVHAAFGEPSAPVSLGFLSLDKAAKAKFRLQVVRNASDYRLLYREPSDCEPDNCDFFVGIDTNEGDMTFLDFYLVGKAEGWVAVGFSETSSMVSRTMQLANSIPVAYIVI